MVAFEKKKTGMARIAAVLLALILAFGMLAGCAGQKQGKDDGKIRIVTTIFPVYDWVRQIVGEESDRVQITMLMDNGADLHNYQPTAQDMAQISSCDLFIYVGGLSDDWVRDALKNDAKDSRVTMDLMQILGDRVREEELVEGMQAEEEEEEEGEGPEFDEHIWLSLKNAALLTEAIAGELEKIDPDNAERYSSNAEAYCGALKELDGAYEAAVADAGKDTLLFADRFPFRYLVEDYGLRYYAVFVGCSAETEASFDTVIFLAQKTDELGLNAICQIETSDGTLAQTVKQTTQAKDQKILTLDSMQNLTKKDAESGKTYLEIMQENLDVLKEALS